MQNLLSIWLVGSMAVTLIIICGVYLSGLITKSDDRHNPFRRIPEHWFMCSWCRCWFSSKGAKSKTKPRFCRNEISHGICSSCAEPMKAEMKLKMQKAA